MKNKNRILKFLVILCMIIIPIIKGSSSSIIESVVTHKETNASSLSTDSQIVSSNVIVIDAGHGGYDSGSISADGIYEKDITLSIAMQVGELLRDAGYEVVYTRSSDDVSWSNDNLDDLRTRVQLAEESSAAYYISIHTNASDNYDDGAYGFETYLDYSNDTIIEMAEEISSNLTSLSYTQDRGIKSTEENSLYVINKNSIPALLLEIGFITDRDDAAYIGSFTGQANIAEAIANGIISSL